MDVKELQHFLGYANFCQRFIWGFSSITTSLTALVQKGPTCLKWSHPAELGFSKVRSTFTTVPVLKHPDPSKSFTVEVYASESGVEALLSQNFGLKPELHPVAFYSKKLLSRPMRAGTMVSGFRSNSGSSSSIHQFH